jgi:hypothetical protein
MYGEMSKYLTKCEDSRPLVIYDFVTAPCILNFLIYGENVIFLSVYKKYYMD